MRSRSTILFSILITLTVGLFLLDLAVGAVNIPIRDVWAALTGGNCSRATEKIVLNIRLIKAIVALLAGAARWTTTKRKNATTGSWCSAKCTPAANTGKTGKTMSILWA